MIKLLTVRHVGLLAVSIIFASAQIVATTSPLLADEGGVSFWLPGQFGSLAATPQQPGLSVATIYYHTSVKAQGDVSASREIEIGKFKPTLKVDLNINLKARADLAVFSPTYVFATPVLGGQLAVGMAGIYGRNNTTLDGTLTAALSTAAGTISTTRSGTIDSSLTGFGDLYPQASLRWNSGVHNFMVYSMADLPVGAYDSTRLANLGIGHYAIDGGGGYTYFDPTKGHEFSAVSGITYNYTNPYTQYRNGNDFHVDWAASQFLSKQFFIGGVGYFYKQFSDDSGAPPGTDGFKSRVSAVGPQFGFLFPVGNMQGVLNLKGYWEFDESRRAHGWNTWLVFAITPAAPEQQAAAAQRRPMSAR